MRKLLTSLVLAVALFAAGCGTLPSQAASTTAATAICGGLPVYRANGHQSMVGWARAHHAYVSTIILSTMDYCTTSGRRVVLRIVRQMDRYVNLGNQRLVMPRGMIFTSPPQAQHAP